MENHGNVGADLMASALDVWNGIAQILGTAFYPSGVPAGTNPASPVVGACVRCYAGWPERDQLDKDLAAGIVNVSVYQFGASSNTTRYPAVDIVTSTGTSTLAWAVSGAVAALSGTISAPQNLALLIDGIAYGYAVQSTDTLAGIAASFAAAISVNQTAVATGATIAVPNSHSISGRVGSVGTTSREVSRQKTQIMATVWAPTPMLRSSCANAIDQALADLRRFTLPDGSIASIVPFSSRPNDAGEKALLYRWDFIYAVEYATTIAGTAAQITVFTENVQVVTGIPVPPGIPIGPVITKSF